MQLEEKYRIERAKWDAEAEKHFPKLRPLPDNLNLQDYFNAQYEMQGIADFLGDLRGKRVLEYGCGLGFISTLLAKAGAKVTAFDISMSSVRVGFKRAEINRMNDRIAWTVAAGEKLPYADETFDIVFGKGILHHLEVDSGWPELYRVLKSGGKAAFAEPMGMNPVLNFVREYVPYPHKNAHGADRPLNYEEIRSWGRSFSKFQFQEIQLFSMIERGFGFHKNFRSLRRLDAALLTKIPSLRRYCRYVVLLMVK